MHNGARRGSILVVLIFLMLFLGNGNDAGAQPRVELEIDPDIRTIALDAPKEISIVAYTSPQDVQYAWSLKGPGELLGEATSPGRLYAPPASLRETATALITVTVTDAQGKQTTATVTFTLVVPPATPTPPIIPPSIRKIALNDEKGFFIHLPGDGKYRLKSREKVQIEVIVDNPSGQLYKVEYVPQRGTMQANTYFAPANPGEFDTVLIRILTETTTDTQNIDIKIIDAAYR